jgi:hypothetical protein
MQLIVIFSVALFIILVSGIMYLIFGEGDIGSGALMVMSMVIVCAGGFGVFAALTSFIPSPVFGNEPTPSIENAPVVLFMSIENTSFCSGSIGPDPCESSTQTNRDVVLYWQTLNGVGCCATYGCDYEAFAEACIIPEFKLYNLYLDGVPVDFTEYNMYQYDYVCSDVVPWNYWTFSNVELGMHTIRIEQKDCEQIVSVNDIDFNYFYKQKKNEN